MASFHTRLVTLVCQQQCYKASCRHVGRVSFLVRGRHHWSCQLSGVASPFSATLLPNEPKSDGKGS
eukprot:3768193-Amphidinium_carterae.1